MSPRTVVVYECLVDVPGPGTTGDGTRVMRARSEANLWASVQGRTAYGRPLRREQITRADVPAHLARRWGLL